MPKKLTTKAKGRKSPGRPKKSPGRPKKSPGRPKKSPKKKTTTNKRRTSRGKKKPKPSPLTDYEPSYRNTISADSQSSPPPEVRENYFNRNTLRWEDRVVADEIYPVPKMPPKKRQPKDM